jgi:hypothetical protein
MKANSFFEELNKYLENTPREQVLVDWAKSADFDTVGPTLEEFLGLQSRFYHVTLEDPLESEIKIVNQKFSPKFDSGFLFPSIQNIFR